MVCSLATQRYIACAISTETMDGVEFTDDAGWFRAFCIVVSESGPLSAHGIGVFAASPPATALAAQDLAPG